MKDELVIATDFEHHLRIYACTTTNLCEEARHKHDLWPTSAAALGRVLSVGAMMGGMLKNEQERISIQINGNGPIGTIMVDASYDGKIRGFVGDPHVHLINNHNQKLAVGMAVGTQGYLKVIKDLSLKNDFTGTVALQSGEIGDDFAYYFTVSEQTPSAVSVGVLVKEDNTIQSAGGLIIQMMPDATDEDIDYAQDALSHLKPISELINEQHCAEQIVRLVSKDAEILDCRTLMFECPCTKESMTRGLFTLSNEERQEMIDEDHGCEVVCHFCNNHYHFSSEELQRMNELKSSIIYRHE